MLALFEIIYLEVFQSEVKNKNQFIAEFITNVGLLAADQSRSGYQQDAVKNWHGS